MPSFAPHDPTATGADPPGDLALRPAAASDLGDLVELAIARDGGDRQRRRQGFGRDLEADDRRLWVATTGRRVVAYGRLGRHDPAEDLGTNPAGWYLDGLIVAGPWRRRGIGAALTGRRLEWLSGRTGAAYYVANENNLSSIALHAAFGFVEIARGIRFPGVEFEGGQGLLFAVELGDAGPEGVHCTRPPGDRP